MLHLRRGAFACLCTIGFLAAGDLQAAPPKAADNVAGLLQDREYAKAVQAIDKLIGTEQADSDYLLYLKGRALHLQKKYDEAIAAFDQLNREFPDSQWARQARFAKGLSYARSGDFQKAEVTYRAEAEYLFSEDRKQEIADIYLEYADTYFDPPEDDQEPDYEKARDFYQRALNVGPKAESRIRVELLVAGCQLKLEEYEDATARYRRFIGDNEDHPLVVEARFQLGETLLAAGENAAAREAWQDLLGLHRDRRPICCPRRRFR